MVKEYPLPPDTEFRYLGAYISLSLSSKKQIQIINNTIMNWRWRAIAQKIDTAMLASTITEYLLPKIELGLLYAYGITEVMCRGWTRTILHTLASIAGLNKTQIGNMSIEAFCVLTGIPDVGLRMQTLRITEFFLLINSHNCISGKTTLARLCALTHQSSTQIEQVLQDLFHKDTKINHRKKNRLADTVKWMKKFELQITDKGKDKSDIIEKINNLSETLRNNTNPNQHILAYTDGSTETRKRKSQNSGYGIQVTTNSHIPICSGGGAVRSDNNFVAEMAAATVVIKALPPDRTLTLYIDSMAAIQAMEKGPVSERKRIKMQGRAWKSFLVPTLAEKRHQICILHVKAHSGLGSPQQEGNDQADKIAKKNLSQASGETRTSTIFYRSRRKFS